MTLKPGLCAYGQRFAVLAPAPRVAAIQEIYTAARNSNRMDMWPMTDSTGNADEYVVPFKVGYLRVQALCWVILSFAMVYVLLVDVESHFVAYSPTTGIVIHNLADIATWSYIKRNGFNLLLIVNFTYVGWRWIQMMQYGRLPIVTMTRDGISIHAPNLDIEMLPWDEIATIQPHAKRGNQIGIVPKDMSSINSRLPHSQRRMDRLSKHLVNNAKREGEFWAPIYIPEKYMFISTDDLMAHIRDFQPQGDSTEALINRNIPPHDSAVWPPPPKAS